MIQMFHNKFKMYDDRKNYMYFIYNYIPIFMSAL